MTRCTTTLGLLLVGCTGVLDSHAPFAPGPASPELEPPITSRCTTPGPLVLPRRLVRLTNAELGRAVSALGSMPAGALPESFAAPPVPQGPNPDLAVSRDFLEQLSTMGLALAAGLRPAAGCDASDFGVEQDCTRPAVATLARRALRGMEDADDVTALTTLAMQVGARSGAEAARRIVMRALLMSPKAIYLYEGVLGAEPGAERRLTGAELASFLSFRVNGGPPSEALLAALTAPTNPEQLSAILTQLLGARSLDVAAQDFLSDWLEVPDVTRSNKDLTVHPFATGPWLRSLQLEDYTRLGALAENEASTLSTLLTGPQRSQVAMDDANPAFAAVGRVGVLSLPGVMAGASGMHETLIPRRGRFLLRRVLCESLSAPPANAVSMTPPIPEGSSERRKFELIEQVPTCGGCHARIDKLAVPLEVVDEVGRLRTVDHHGHAIDPAGAQELSSGETLTYADTKDLYGQLAMHPLVQGCFGVQAFRHFSRLPENDPVEFCAGEALTRQHLSPEGHLPVRRLAVSALVQTALAPRVERPEGAMP